MTSKTVKFHNDARNKLYSGLNTLANAVKITLGPKGRSVLVEQSYGSPLIINSGVEVAREIELSDHVENLGAQMVREVAAKTSEVAGDGTTTATVLTQAIVQEGMKYVAAGFDPMDLKRGMDKAVDVVVRQLKRNSRNVTSGQDVAHIAAISVGGDLQIGEMISGAVNKVGRDGVIKVEDGRGITNELEVVDGLQFEQGYLSPYFVTGQEKSPIVLDDVLILVCEENISSVQALLPLLEQVARIKQPLLIIAEDVTGDALTALAVNVLNGVLIACAVKAPGFGNNKKTLLEDIAIVTGAHVIASERGNSLEHVQIQHLGFAKRVEIDKKRTTIIRGGEDKDNIKHRIAHIKQLMDQQPHNNSEQKQLQKRLAWLNGGIALIKVGASTETEMKEKKSRLEDALRAAQAAIQEGVGAGGGIAFIRARNALDEMKLENKTQESGIKIVYRALEEPLRQIAINAGADPSIVIDTVVNGDTHFGYNAATGCYGDMLKMGIIDPTKVSRLALINAVSVAGLMLTMDCAVAETEEMDSVTS